MVVTPKVTQLHDCKCKWDDLCTFTAVRMVAGSSVPSMPSDFSKMVLAHKGQMNRGMPREEPWEFAPLLPSSRIPVASQCPVIKIPGCPEPSSCAMHRGTPAQSVVCLFKKQNKKCSAM